MLGVEFCVFSFLRRKGLSNPVEILSRTVQSGFGLLQQVVSFIVCRDRAAMFFVQIRVVSFLGREDIVRLVQFFPDCIQCFGGLPENIVCFVELRLGIVPSLGRFLQRLFRIGTAGFETSDRLVRALRQLLEIACQGLQFVLSVA